VAPGEVDSIWRVCSSNEEALAHVRSFYRL
jgi:hypothetical protein